MQKPHRDVRYRGDERTWLGCHLRSVEDPWRTSLLRYPGHPQSSIDALL